MKVVFIYPREMDNYSHPLGILYIASYLEKEGHKVKVIDNSLKDSIHDIALAACKKTPDIIGISAATSQINMAIDIAREIKKISHIPIMIGGIHPTIMPYETAANGCFDYIIVGEGEHTTSELLRAIQTNKEPKNIKGLLYKKNGKLIFTGHRPLIEDLDSLPPPARHLLAEDAYFAPPKIRAFWANRTANMMVSRGCPYGCIFCSNHLMFGRKVRFRSPEKIMEEIKDLKLKYNIDSLRFDDDTFTTNKEWAIKFCRLLRKLCKDNGWKAFRWTCQTRVNTVTPEVLLEMKKAGCGEIDFGVESGSPRMLKILEKGITVEQVIKAFDMTRRFGILRGGTFIVGTPGETEADLRLTERLVKRIRPDFADFFFATPYPKTKLWEIAKEKGFKELVPYSQWFTAKITDKPVMCISMAEERMIYWRSRLHNLNWLRDYAHLARDPRFFFGGLKFAVLGYRGIVPGLKRVIKTGKIDSLLVETLHSYRLRLKKSVV